MIMSEQKPFCTRPPLAHFGPGPAAGMLYEAATSPPAVADPRPVTTYGLHSPQGGYQPPNSTFVMAPGHPHLLQFGEFCAAITARALREGSGFTLLNIHCRVVAVACCHCYFPSRPL